MTKQISEEEKKKKEIVDAWFALFGDRSINVEIYTDGVEDLNIYVGDKFCMTFCGGSLQGWEALDLHFPGTDLSDEKGVFQKDEEGNYQGRKI